MQGHGQPIWADVRSSLPDRSGAAAGHRQLLRASTQQVNKGLSGHTKTAGDTMNVHDWITIARAVGDLFYLAAAILALMAALTDRRWR